MALVGSVWAVHSFPGHMGVNLIFHSIERTHILWRDQDRDTSMRHFVLMSLLTPNVWGWVSGGVWQLKSLAKTGPSYLHKRLPPSAMLFMPTQGISTPAHNTRICAHKRLGLLRRISTGGRLRGAARAKVSSSLLLLRDCFSAKPFRLWQAEVKFLPLVWQHGTADRKCGSIRNYRWSHHWLVSWLWGSVMLCRDPHTSICLETKQKESKGSQWFLCLSQWYFNRCLRGEIQRIWSLGWILLMVLKSRLLLGTIFLSVSLKVCKGSSKIKMLSWSCVKRKRLQAHSNFGEAGRNF